MKTRISLFLAMLAWMLAASQPLLAQQMEHDHGAHDSEPGTLVDRALGQSATSWTCPMHPQIIRDAPGSCPICGMDLVQRAAQQGPEVRIDLAGGVQQAMNLRTAVVERGRLFRAIDTVGRVEVDQSRLVHRHPRVEGWIGDLDVATVGSPVREGQRLYTLYARELVNIQEEWLQALAGGRTQTARAARQRLEILDVQPRVLDRIEAERALIEYLPWYAERDGYLSTLNVRPGAYVAPGTEIMQIADPSSVWLIADVLAGQIDWIEIGQIVRIEFDSHPELRLRGPIEFIYPELDPTTRAARVRVRLDNVDQRLQPGDWARVRIFAGPKDDILFLPSEALIRTGESVRVIVRNDDGSFGARSIRAGLESGEFTEVLSGLHEGETVVRSGQFLIDSEASIRAAIQRLGTSSAPDHSHGEH
ncbi:efflux RND transporter periplasmic adaptor subunit [Wenzhouxiangella marina]|uniref:Copper/silver efflux pump MFP component CusB n=1 Tax=Wenzhouxiangella marina TaxID=1579979 RepID=A0A0K0XWQ2_9GAMM|nr:efflux RND transporter periplasmic adaptor subunit [Wenzhouxiangella marina]AKS42046.1 Copper/silver efflux pump MFP component CusB [Wenzhouxiangella marina]MBB6086185.1 Cu(I)/Ag(I) efflux system membrane fusion protein [Wenzhouxiangella marina]